MIFTFSTVCTAKRQGMKIVKINLGKWRNTVGIPRNNGNFYFMLIGISL